MDFFFGKYIWMSGYTFQYGNWPEKTLDGLLLITVRCLTGGIHPDLTIGGYKFEPNPRWKQIRRWFSPANFHTEMCIQISIFHTEMCIQTSKYIFSKIFQKNTKIPKKIQTLK